MSQRETEVNVVCPSKWHIRQIQECPQMKLDTLQKRVEKSPLLKSFIGINHFKRSSLLSMIF